MYNFSMVYACYRGRHMLLYRNNEFVNDKWLKETIKDGYEVLMNKIKRGIDRSDNLGHWEDRHKYWQVGVKAGGEFMLLNFFPKDNPTEIIPAYRITTNEDYVTDDKPRVTAVVESADDVYATLRLIMERFGLPSEPAPFRDMSITEAAEYIYDFIERAVEGDTYETDLYKVDVISTPRMNLLYVV